MATGYPQARKIACVGKSQALYCEPVAVLGCRRPSVPPTNDAVLACHCCSLEPATETLVRPQWSVTQRHASAGIPPGPCIPARHHHTAGVNTPRAGPYMALEKY